MTAAQKLSSRIRRRARLGGAVGFELDIPRSRRVNLVVMLHEPRARIRPLTCTFAGGLDISRPVPWGYAGVGSYYHSLRRGPPGFVGSESPTTPR